MNEQLLIKLGIVGLALAASGTACFAEEAEPAWQFGLAYRLGFNTKVSFENIGTPAAPNNPSVSGKSYSDGFVGIDSTGNALDLTTHWGYDRADQVVSGTLALRNSEAGALGQADDPYSNGFELSIARQLGKGRNIRWGVEGAFGFSAMGTHSSGAASSSVLGLDSYSMEGVQFPPVAPYSGPATAGPGSPLIGTSPSTVPVFLQNDFDASLYGFRLGLYVEFPVSKRVCLSFGGGLSMAVVDGTYSFSESIGYPYSAFAKTGSSGYTDVLVGGYVKGQVSVNLGRRRSLYTGIQWHDLGNFQQSSGEKRVNLNLESSLYWVTGIGWKF